MKVTYDEAEISRGASVSGIDDNGAPKAKLLRDIDCKYIDVIPAHTHADIKAAAKEAGAWTPHVRLASIAALVMVVVLGGLTGWLGFRTTETHQADQQRSMFLQVGRQCALNLTTIDFQHADADVQRILDSATGPFYGDFQKHAQPFIDFVKQAQSKSVGTIAEAGIEAESENGAQVLVVVIVKTSDAVAPEQEPRAWRMRITVQKVGAEKRVSNVEFVH